MSANENYHLEVIKDFERALEESDDYDVIIKAGDEKEVRAHSSILRARSSYFKRALSSDWEEKDDNGKFIFKKPNISSEVFHLIFRYLYTGIIDIDQCNKNIVSQLLIACDELGLCKLIEHIQGYISEKKGYLQENPVGTLESIYKVETFQNIKDECLEIICEDPRILFTSENPTTDKSIITMILQSDDLNMEEIEIWESLLRWIFIRHLKIDKESMWTSESSEVSTEIKQIIQEYIPLIRFYDISKEDFFLKVYPYRNFLPQDLLNDVLRYHMVPNSIPTVNFKLPRNPRTGFNSVFVSKRLFRLFAKWIDKRSEDYAVKDVPYKFNLLLRGTRDGFDSAKFHQLCDSKGATISIARVKDSKQIVGGYNPLNWCQNGQYANTGDSFLFNITDSNDLNSAKIGRVFQSSQNAIFNHSSYGPTFGGGNDLRGQGNTWNASNGNTYTNINLPTNFTIDEYEVFQVVKKS